MREKGFCITEVIVKKGSIRLVQVDRTQADLKYCQQVIWGNLLEIQIDQAIELIHKQKDLTHCETFGMASDAETLTERPVR